MLVSPKAHADQPAAPEAAPAALGQTGAGHARPKALAAVAAACALAIGGEATLLRTHAALPAVPLFLAGVVAIVVAARLLPARERPGGRFAVVGDSAWLQTAVVALAANAAALLLLARNGRANTALFLWAVSVPLLLAAAWLRDGRPGVRVAWRREAPALVALGALLAVGAIIRLLWLDHEPYGFWWDEAFGSLVSEHLLRDSTYRPVFVDFPGSGPALYPYLGALAFKLLGASQLAWRLPAALGGVAGIAAAYLAGRALYGRAAGLLAAAILTTLPWQVTFSREVIEGQVWSVTFDMFAMAFLVAALRKRSWLAAALGGVSLGLGLNTYYASQAMAAVLALALVLFWLRRPRAAFRPTLLLGLAFAAGVLWTVSPLAEFALQHPDQFSQRTQMLSIFTEMRDAHSSAPLVGNIEKHLLMFNLQGDHNPRHNYPNAPELNVILAGLAVLGMGVCLARARRPEYLLLPCWWAVMLAGGVLSISSEAPQSLRTLDEVNVMALLAALPLGLAVQAAGGRWRSSAIVRAGHVSGLRRFAPAGALLAVTALVVASGVIDVHRYFIVQQHDASVIAEHSIMPTIVARQVDTLPPGTTIYMDERVINEPTIQFLAPQITKETPFALDLLPFRAAVPTAVYLGTDDQTALALLHAYYPQATLQNLGGFYGNPPVMEGVLLQPTDIAGIQGVRASYTAAAGGAATTRTEPTLEVRGDRLPVAAPARAHLQSVLEAPTYGAYALQLQGPADATLRLDDTTIRAGEPVQVTLATGPHALDLTATVGAADTLRLLWQPPGAAALTSVPREALYASRVAVNGLLGSYYANPNWTAPAAFQQIDPNVAFDYHLLPLNRPFSVEWDGQVAASTAGLYHFATSGVDATQLWIDGRLLVDNPAPNAFREGQLTLTAGLHTLRLRYTALTNFNHVELYWQPPGQASQIIPPAYLFPSRAAGEAQPLPALAAATPPPAQPAVSGPSSTLPVVWQRDAAALGASSAPSGLAADAAGDLYVADPGRHTLDKLSADGRLLWSAAPPSSAGALRDPDAVALAADGSVLLLDASDGTIYRFSPASQYLDKRGGPALGAYNPRGLAVGPNGDLYIADTGKGRVLRLAPSGQLVQSFGTPGAGLGALREPTGVALTADGQVAVLDPTLGKIVVFAPSGGAVREWSFPKNATVDGPQLTLARGDLWATDRQGARVLRYDVQGHLLGAYAAGGLAGPNGLAVAGAALYVSDPGAKRIVKLGLGG